MKPKPVNFQNDLSLGYIVGTVAGDGYITFGRGSYIIGMHVKDEDFIKAFASHLKLIDLRPKIFFYRGFFHLRAHSKLLYTYLKNLRKEEIMQNSEGFKKLFLKGLFDSDGGVISTNLKNPRKATRGIGLANNNKELIFMTKEILLRFGIDSNIRSRVHSGFGSKKIQYELTIYGLDDIGNFSNLIGFSIKRKQDKLEAIINSFRNTIKCQNCNSIVNIKGHQPAIKYCKICSILKDNEYKRKYRKTQRGKELDRMYTMKWREKNREKYRAYMKIYLKNYRMRKRKSSISIS